MIINVFSTPPPPTLLFRSGKPPAYGACLARQIGRSLPCHETVPCPGRYETNRTAGLSPKKSQQYPS